MVGNSAREWMWMAMRCKPPPTTPCRCRVPRIISWVWVIQRDTCSPTRSRIIRVPSPATTSKIARDRWSSEVSSMWSIYRMSRLSLRYRPIHVRYLYHQHYYPVPYLPIHQIMLLYLQPALTVPAVPALAVAHSIHPIVVAHHREDIISRVKMVDKIIVIE